MADFDDEVTGALVEDDEDSTGFEGVLPPDDFLEEAEGNRDNATEAFLKHIRETYADDVAADEHNRKAMAEDLGFVAGEQWPTEVEQLRLSRGKPVMTINRLPAFVGQVVGNRRLNEAAIKVLPDAGGDKAVAQVRQGLIRSIEKTSKAKIVYDTAHLHQVVSGDGAFMLEVDFADDDVFEQDIRLTSIDNPLSVTWDRFSNSPTGEDAAHVFVEDLVPEEAFKALYPEASIREFSGGGNSFLDARAKGWFAAGSVRVVSFWRMRSNIRTLILTTEGAVEDVTDLPEEEWASRVMVNPVTGDPYIRRSNRRFAEQYVTNGVELLDGPFRLPVRRLPVFRVSGWKLNVKDKVHRWGLVRFMKDPQRMHNYWRSVVVEKLMQAPKAAWIAADNAVAGREEAFRDSASSDDPLLIFNAEAGAAPQRVPPVQMEQALLQEAGMSVQDLRDVSNIHEASLGQQSNEVSGRALTARQRVGEVGMLIYQQNLNAAIEEAGRCMNQLIPYVYDTVRSIKVLGEDDAEEVLEINNEGGIDISTGKYSVTITTGPSFATKRAEAAESMLNMINAMPQTLAVAADKIIEAQDWPGAEEITRRIRMNLPPGMVDDEELTPEQRQLQQQQAERAQIAAQLEEAAAQAEIAMKQAQALDFQARAQEAQARAVKAIAEIETNQLRALSQAERESLKSTLDILEQLQRTRQEGLQDG